MGMEAALCSPFYDNLLQKTGLAVLSAELLCSLAAAPDLFSPLDPVLESEITQYTLTSREARAK